MRRLLRFIIAGSVAAASAQAVAGGLPETKANGDAAETEHFVFHHHRRKQFLLNQLTDCVIY